MKPGRLSLLLLAAFVLPLSPAWAETGSRLLPFGASWAGGRELPLPFGVSAIGYWQEHGYDLTRLSASSATDPRIERIAPLLDPGSLDVENEVVQIGIKADAWLFPFLNVSALAGYIEGETEVDFGSLRDSMAMAAMGGGGGGMLARILPPGFDWSEALDVLDVMDRGMDVEYSGFVYGVAGMLAWGAGPAFATVDGIATWTDLDMDVSVEAYLVRPIVGLRAGNFAAWTGAMYQAAEETQKGDIDVPGLGRIAYDIEMEEKEPWNWLVGGSCALSKTWSVALECGFGDRTQVQAALTGRF